jgi:hypothetical protein
MADFELELELTARIDDLERGMKDAQKAVERSSEKMEEATNEVSEGAFTPLIDKIAKVAAGLFLAEGAFKIGAASARAFAGDTESMAAALMSIPVIGPLITSMTEFGTALEYASESAFKARAKLAELREEAKSLDVTVGILGDRISSFAELQRLLGTDEATIAEFNFDREMQRLEATHRAKLLAIDEERMARHEALEADDLTFEEQRKREKQINEDRRRAIEAAEETLHLQRKIVEQKLKQVKATQAEADLAKEAEFAAKRQAELDAEAESHHQFMLELAEEQKKKDEARLKRDEERLAIAKKIEQAEQEVAKARAEAQKNVSRATATFSTAGGSFTAGVSAQLNEAKLLTKISTASKELLAEIVRNTAGIGAGLV